MHIVTLIHLGNKFYLRNTIWSAHIDRATIYTSAQAAQDALDRAKKFMKAAQYKAAKIEPHS